MKTAPKAPSGAGSIERLPSGSYRLCLRVQGRKIQCTFETREAAERQLDALRFELSKAQLQPAGPLTLQGFGSKWLATRTNRNARDDAHRWHRHIAGGALGSVELHALTRQDVRAWLIELLAAESTRGGALSRQSVRHCLNLLRRALQDAMDEGLIAENPAAGLRMPGRDVQVQDRWTFLRPEEIAQLLDFPELPPSARAAFSLAIFGGLRQGELIGLHWRDVLPEGDRPHVVVRHSHKGPTKSGRIRRVPLLAPARQALASWRASSQADAAGLVFPAADGGHHAPGYDWGWADRSMGADAQGNRRPALLGWKTRAGILRPVRFHDLRHTCASHLLMGTWGPPFTLSEVRELLGHSTAQLTERYAHLSPDHLLARAGTLSQFRGTR